MLPDFMDREAPPGRYVRIDPLEPRVEFNDMVDFADPVKDKTLRRLLDVALE